MDTPFTQPAYQVTSFNCPHCGAFTQMVWDNLFRSYMGSMEVRGLESAHCFHCNDFSLWLHEELIYPAEISVENPNKDLPQEIKDDYLEAANILTNSPRGAAALLRLSIEKLADHLKATGTDLNQKIGNLVTKGLSPKIQKALDVVRVVGNHAVHPGQINLDDKPEIANALFKLVNVIADEMITKPGEVDALFEELVPPAVKEKIEKRDNK